MVNALKKNVSRLPAGNYGESTTQSTRRCHRPNEGKSGLESERVRALGALCSLRSKKKLSAEKRQETHFLSNQVKEKWIKDYAERETAVARMRVPDAENDMRTAENAGATTRKFNTTFEGMLNAIGESLIDLACSDDAQRGEDKEDDEEDSELGKLSDDDETGWVIRTICKTVQRRMESSQQKQIRLHQLTQPGWGEASDYFCECDMKYGTAELKVLAVLKPRRDTTAAAPSPTTVGEHMQTLDIVRGEEQMPAVTSLPGSSQMRLALEKPQLHKFIPVLSLDRAPDSTPIEDAKPVVPVCFYPCIKHL